LKALVDAQRLHNIPPKIKTFSAELNKKVTSINSQNPNKLINNLASVLERTNFTEILMTFFLSIIISYFYDFFLDIENINDARQVQNIFRQKIISLFS
jgi:hypothetical protein